MSGNTSAREKNGWQWWAGRDEEWLTVGPCATRDEVIAEALSDFGPGEGDFIIMEAVMQPARGLDADTILDDFWNAICDDSDLYSSEHDLPEWGLPTDQQKVATAELHALLSAWNDKWLLPHITPPNMFAETRKAEAVRNTVDPDMLPGGHDNRGVPA